MLKRRVDYFHVWIEAAGNKSICVKTVYLSASITAFASAYPLLKQPNNLNTVIACNFLEMKNWRQSYCSLRFPKFIVRRLRVRVAHQAKACLPLHAGREKRRERETRRAGLYAGERVAKFDPVICIKSSPDME